MKRAIAIAAAATLLALPQLAAAEVFSFHSTETSALGSPVYDFSLDTSKATVAAEGFNFADVTISKDGVATTGNSVGAAYGTNISSPLFFYVDTDPSSKPFYTLDSNGLVFNTGAFSIADGNTDGEGTLTISGSPVSAAPEPGAWTLLIAGVACMGAALRFSRRRQGTPAIA